MGTDSLLFFFSVCPSLESFSFSHSYRSPFPISRISQNNRISYNRHVFPGLSVGLVQLLNSKGTSFYVFRVVISAKIWHPLTYFALTTISSTLQPIW